MDEQQSATRMLKRLDDEMTDAFFKPCPFCGEVPNVFEVPENRYLGEENCFGWVIECKTMGCMFKRSRPDQSLKHLTEEWNKRFVKYEKKFGLDNFDEDNYIARAEDNYENNRNNNSHQV